MIASMDESSDRFRQKLRPADIEWNIRSLRPDTSFAKRAS